MNGRYSTEVAKAIQKIWLSHSPRQMREGYEMLRKASEAGDADAMCYFARCHLGESYVWSGAGFPVDPDLASELISEAVGLGSATAVLCALRSGMFSPEMAEEMPFDSLREAYDEILSQAEDGDAFCLYMIGNVMFWGDYMLIDPDAADRFSTEEEYYRYAYPIAADFYQQSFEAGLSSGFGNYRTIYESGLADMDGNVFEEHMEMLAESGDPLVCNDYGKWLEDEYDDADHAFEYYRRAVELGDQKSAYNVGTCYGRGYGVDEDPDKAFEYYLIAAREGHPMAQFQVGNFYFEGRGSLPCDHSKAYRWLSMAHENEDCGEDTSWRAAAELGVLVQAGLGTAQDDVRAYRYLSEAEKHLDEVWEPLDAMVLNALGLAYGFGRGTAENIDRAVGYFDRAIDYGSEEARANKARFKRSLFGLGRWTRR
ncbi:MAG: sel1 repeat family protein [Duncaniella sp.]|uniref:tetratricopeptide repeat protein n=1 Tax=Duncaniella sp. TaxID=2518496 RepID=UPI0023D16219|nr:tetratricopeptide repeat protein [Duncaniella sp.]MDE5989155.1 sel1 repeat family protein [Duncaniella sp.]